MVINVKYLKFFNGTTTELECNCSGNPMPTYRWEQNGIELLNQNRIVLNGDTSDKGTYTCVAENVMAPTYGPILPGQSNMSLDINVLYEPSEPKFIINGAQVDNGIFTALRGSNVLIECQSHGNPTPSVYVGHASALQIGGRQLVKNIQDADTGVYRCVAENVMTPSFGPNKTGQSENSILINIKDEVMKSASPSLIGVLLPLLGAGVSLLLFLVTAAAIVWRCRMRYRGKQDETVENPMYISADDIIIDEIVTQKDDTVSM
ncbi:contactin-5-like [Dreissena polymorpha]|uniref:Ig-like domain-containing protein n=1 Tax=Dreissena polymorpha TaxID=45954 RepID=A0A9D4R9M7_DREPO|nr:contactin-5-like [Dreissena polymorpha]KAH3858722.1 hypothetical protein DPMN_101349 [Dreissena polymorpha]